MLVKYLRIYDVLLCLKNRKNALKKRRYAYDVTAFLRFRKFGGSEKA